MIIARLRSFPVLSASLSLVLAVALAGCSNCGDPVGDDDDDDDDDDAGEGEGEAGEGEGEGEGEFPVTPEARELCEIFTRGQVVFVAAIAGSFAGATRCSVVDAPAFPDPALFAAAAAEACADDTNPVVQDFARAIAGGRVTFNQANIEACSALDLLALAEEGVEELPPECDVNNLMVGLQDEGDVCEQDWDCSGALLCQASDIHVQSLTCLPPAEVGQPCLDASAFIGGVFTNFTLAVRSCAADAECGDAFVCVAKAGLGQPCDAAECVDGLRCDTAQATPVCAALGDVGDGCGLDGDCVEGLVCNAASLCDAPVDDNDNCVAGTDACSANCSVCRPTTVGGAVTTCQDRGAAGAPCAVLDDCRAGFVCDDVAGACVAGGVGGDACSDNEECAAGFVCSVPGTCIVQPGLGDPCDPDITEDCSEGSCAAGACRAGALGEPCDDDGDCVGGRVCNGGTQVCAAPSTGGPCSVGGECATGFACDAGECVLAPVAGEPCLAGGTCDVNFFCDADDTCQVKRGGGEQCAADQECFTRCVDGQCGAVGPSCNTSKGFFPLFVLLSGALPLRRLRRLYRDVRAAQRSGR